LDAEAARPVSTLARQDPVRYYAVRSRAAHVLGGCCALRWFRRRVALGRGAGNDREADRFGTEGLS